MTSPLARTVPSSRATHVEDFDSIACLMMRLNVRLAAEAKQAKINDLLVESFEITRLYVNTRNPMLHTRFIAIEVELMGLGLDLT